MMTVSEVSKLTGNSVRTLHYYDEIGLLKPTEVTGAGYRLYDNDALARLQTMGYTGEMMEKTAEDIMKIFAEFGQIRGKSPDSTEAQDLVRKLQTFITDNYYTCTDQILAGLGQMYAAGGEMTDNIDAAGGAGTAEFTAEAIGVYVNK